MDRVLCPNTSTCTFLGFETDRPQLFKDTFNKNTNYCPMKYVSIVLVVLSGILLGSTEKERPREEIKTIKVAIFLYNGVELLDFSGPAEVFAATAFRDEQGKYRRPFEVYTVQKAPNPY